MTAVSLIGALGVFSVVFTSDPLKGRLWALSVAAGALLIVCAVVLDALAPTSGVWV